ncbi:acidic mammalian chitinase-like [Uranotaenia lowii]|uniref:acidic mammalian chitinase-like n=1 Tax=Uranotaenia lowii TaxID=190385 RepID=UPI0024790E2B|nr:acidic mammalian chitinase-like [Uranotaenia lowii]
MIPDKWLLAIGSLFSFLCLANAQANIVCYYSSWAVYRPGRGQFEVEFADPFHCTHFVYAFVGLDWDGTVKILDPWGDLDDDWGLGQIRRFNELKNLNPNLKTLVAIGGDSEGSEVFSHVAANPQLRQVFAQDARRFCLQHGFDGFDVDWEYPGLRGGDPINDRQNFVLMLRDLREALQPSGLILTAAVAAPQNIAEIVYDIPAISVHLDLIHLMTYDYNGAWNSDTGHNAPLHSGPADRTDFERTLNVHHSVSYWLQQGAPANKLIMGIPLYGRNFKLQNSSNNGLRAPAIGPGNVGPYTGEPGYLAYLEYCPYIQQSWLRFWNDYQKIVYGVSGDQWVGYEDLDTLSYKCQYIRSRQLGGAMVWSYDQDDFRGTCGEIYPMMKALNRCFN